MLRFLHQLSAAFFYILGSSFFVAFVLIRNGVLNPLPAEWMQIADLPLALTAILFGGLSFYLSLKPNNKHSFTLGAVIGIPLSACFVLLVFLKFIVR